MKTKNIFKIFIMLISFFICFSTPVSASGLTDINELDNMFTFENNTGDSSLLDTSMKFNAGQKEETMGFWQKVADEYKGIIIGVSGVCTLTFALLFLFNFTKLGTTAGNPQARRTVQLNLLWTGLCAAAAGAVGLFVSFGINLLK